LEVWGFLKNEDMNSLLRHQVLFTARYYSSYGNEFQEFFEEIMDAADPDFCPVGLGSDGDWGADGISLVRNTIYQVYAPPISTSGWKEKVIKDTKRAAKKWGDKVKIWIFVYRHRGRDLPPEMHECIGDIRTNYRIEIQYWGFLKLWDLVSKLEYSTRCGLLGDYPSPSPTLSLPNYLTRLEDIISNYSRLRVSGHISKKFDDGSIIRHDSQIARIFDYISPDDKNTSFSSATLLGSSGSGKTITAIQTGMSFAQNGWTVLYSDLESLEVTIDSNLLCEYLLSCKSPTLVILDNVNSFVTESYLVLNGLNQNLRESGISNSPVRILLTFRMERSYGNPLLQRFEMISSLSNVVSLFLNEEFGEKLARRSLSEVSLKTLDISELIKKTGDSIPRFEAAIMHFKNTGLIDLSDLYKIELENILSLFEMNPHLKTTAEITLKIISIFSRLHCMVSFVFLNWTLNELKLPNSDYVMDRLLDQGYLSLSTYETETLLGIFHPEIANGILNQNIASVLSLFSIDTIENLERYFWTEYIKRASNDLPLFLISLCYNLWEQERYGFAQDILNELLRKPLSNPELSKGLTNLSLLLFSEGLSEETYESLDLALSLNPNDAYSWVNLGALFSTSGNNSKALESFEKAITISPDLAVAHVNIGIIKESLGDTEGALLSLKTAVEIEDDEPYLWAWYGYILSTSGKIESAIDAYEKSIELAPEWIRPRILLATALIQQGQKKDAMRLIVDISRTPHLDNESLEILARLLSSLSRKSKALEFLIRAKELFPSYARYWHAIAILMKERGESDKFIEEYKSKSHRLEGTSFELVSFGLILEDLREFNESKELFTIAVSQFDDSTTPTLFRLITYIILGHLDKAKEIFTSEDVDRNELEERICDIGTVRFESGALDCAKEIIDVLEELIPNNPTIWRLKGDILKEKGDLSGAINALRKAIKINPDYSDAWISLGHRYYEAHYIEDAETAIKHAIETIEESPFPEYAWNTLGMYYLGRKMYLQALEALKKSVELNPKLAISRKNLGLLYLQLDRKKDAEKQLKLAEKLWPSLRGRPSTAKIEDILGSRIPRSRIT